MIGFHWTTYVPKLQDTIAVLRVGSRGTKIYIQIPAPPLQEAAGRSEGDGAWKVPST